MATKVRPRKGATAVSRSGLVEPSESSAEPFRTLRVSLELRPDSRRGNLIVFTSAEPDEGKSTIAANYALVSAVNDRRVLLVDLDLRNPTQHEIFSLPRSPGMTEVIASKIGIGQMVNAVPGVPGLHVITAGMIVPRAGDITGSPTVRDLLTQVSVAYDVVVVDTPPLLAAADAAHIAAHPAADVAFVVDARQHSRKVKRAAAKLELVNANLLGYVVNREGRLSDYGYNGYGYG